MRAEEHVKAIFPDAEIRYDFVIIQSHGRPGQWDWSSDPNDFKTILALGLWIDKKCIVYGGKFEHILWRRGWKKIQKDMLEKLKT